MLIIFQLDHGNIPEDFLWTVPRSTESIGFTCACILIDLLMSRSMRWLAGKATQLTDWSPFKIGWVYGLLENLFADIAPL
eukprot:6213644-Pleurochrysis_carterae.AAC.1